MAKNAPFHIKSPVKNFHGWAKGGASHGAPPKYPTVHIDYIYLSLIHISEPTRPY